jgi:hypothetical protein
MRAIRDGVGTGVLSGKCVVQNEARDDPGKVFLAGVAGQRPNFGHAILSGS